MAAEQQQQAPVILERYRLVRQLGEGGMGAVYEAVHVHLGSRYAVKALRPAGPMPPDQMAEMEKRFLREAKICVSVRHPNLVPVTDFGTTQGVPYIVMDFVDGEDLQHVVDREGALGEGHSLRILRDVASALAALHEHGIVHRDMKPANVMIERASGKVVLTDLGIAKDTSSSVNLTQGILGTPAFMAPEQVMDTASTGPEGDVYGLGATFYCMLTGKRPFEGETAITIIQAARENLFAYGSIAGVSENRDGVRFSPGIHQLLHDMTTYEPRDRIASMKEVVSRAEKILEAARSSSGGRKLPSSDDLTMHLEGGRAPGAAPAPDAGAAAAARPSGRAQPRRADTSSRSAERPKPSVIAALSAADTSVSPRGGGKGAAAMVVLALLAAAAGGGYLAVQKKWVVIPGLNAPRDGGNDEPVPDGNGGDDGGGDGGVAGGGVAGGGVAGGGVAGGGVAGGGGTAGDPATARGDGFDASKLPKLLRLELSNARPPELVLVPAGKFVIGTPGEGSEAEKPSREVEITRPFYIGRHEVTVGQYAAFLAARPPRKSAIPSMDLDAMGLAQEDGKWQAREGAERKPIRDLPHYMARRFCEWVSDVTGLEAELPGEVEWEYAARGPDSHVYPWGNDWEDGLACAGGLKEPREVGSCPDGKSWCGALDMAGNVFEWTADEYVKERYEDLAARDPEVLGAASSNGFRTIRGGCFGNDDYVCRSAYRMGVKGSARQKPLGFRIKARAAKAVLDYVEKHPGSVGEADAGPGG